MAGFAIKRQFLSQPQGRAEVDWNNPLTSGLVKALLPTSGIVTPNGIAGHINKELTLDESNAVVNGGSLVSSIYFTGYPTQWSIPFGISHYQSTGDQSLIEWMVYTASGGMRSSIRVNTGVINGTTRNITKYHKNIPVAMTWTDGSGATGIFYEDNTSYAMHDNVVTWLPQGKIRTLNCGSNNAYATHAFLFNRALSAAEIKSLSANPWQIFRHP